MWDVHKVKLALGGKLIGNPLVKTLVCETILLLPDEIIDYVTRSVWFMSSSNDAWAYTFTGRDLTQKHLIFLSDELFKEELFQVQYTILHEIGHVILGHKNSIGRKQTESEIRIQEIAADKFARKYL